MTRLKRILTWLVSAIGGYGLLTLLTVASAVALWRSPSRLGQARQSERLPTS